MKPRPPRWYQVIWRAGDVPTIRNLPRTRPAKKHQGSTPDEAILLEEERLRTELLAIEHRQIQLKILKAGRSFPHS